MGQLVAPLDDDVGLGPPAIDVALADPQAVVGVRPHLGVDQDLVGAGRPQVGGQGEGLPLGDDGRGTLVGRGRRLGHHHGQVVGLPAAEVAAHGRAARVVDTDQHRLVEHGEAVLVDGDIRGGDHRDDPSDRLGPCHVEGHQPGVGLAREHDPGHERIGRDPIRRETGGSRHLAHGVVALDGFPDRVHVAPPSATRTAWVIG